MAEPRLVGHAPCYARNGRFLHVWRGTVNKLRTDPVTVASRDPPLAGSDLVADL
jgi:hypothetical protein